MRLRLKYPKSGDSNTCLLHSATFPGLWLAKPPGHWLQQWHLEWDRPLGFSLARQNRNALHLFGNMIGKEEKSHWSHERRQDPNDILIRGAFCCLSMSLRDRPLGFPPAGTRFPPHQVCHCGASSSLVRDRRRTSQLIGWATKYTRTSQKQVQFVSNTIKCLKARSEEDVLFHHLVRNWRQSETIPDAWRRQQTSA